MIVHSRFCLSKVIHEATVESHIQENDSQRQRMERLTDMVREHSSKGTKSYLEMRDPAARWTFDIRALIYFQLRKLNFNLPCSSSRFNVQYSLVWIFLLYVIRGGGGIDFITITVRFLWRACFHNNSCVGKSISITEFGNGTRWIKRGHLHSSCTCVLRSLRFFPAISLAFDLLVRST